MRRLLMLLVSLAIAWGAAALLTGGDGAVLVRLRDGGLLAIVAALVAAWWALPVARLSWAEYGWPSSARALYGAGVATALLGAGLSLWGAMSGGAVSAGTVVWVIGLALLIAGALLRGEVLRYAAPAFRWQRDARGGFVRVPQDGATDEQSTGRLWWLSLVLILLAGTALRLWLAWRMPPTCTGWECAQVLGAASSGLSPLQAAINRFLLLFTADALWAMRLSAALVAAATLPAFALLLGRFASSGGLLAGLALLAFSPWHLELGRSGGDVEGVLLVVLALWGSVAGLQAGSVRGWAIAGLAIGLLIAAAPALMWAWAAWLLLLVVLTLTHAERARRSSGLWVVAGAALAGAGALWVAGDSQRILPALAGAPWLQAGEIAGSALAATPMWIAALAISGAGAPVRLGRGGVLLLLTLAAAVVAASVADMGAGGPGLLGAWGVLFAALAVDQILRATQRAWRPLIRPRTFTAWATAIVVALGFLGAWQVIERPAGGSSLAASDREAIALATFARDFAAEPANEDVVLLAPPALVNHPSVRLGAAGLLQAGRLIAMDRIEHVPWTGDAPGGLLYVLPEGQPALADLLRTVYPEGSAGAILETSGAEVLATWRVDPATLFESAGLEQYVYAGAQFGSADEALFSSGVGPLQFEWGQASPVEPPLSAEWQGSLIARESGVYTFSVVAPPSALFSLILDDRLVLDTSAGLVARGEMLPAGTHRVTMRYRSESPGDLTVLWQTPNGDNVPIPREALFNPPLPMDGLTGAYMASADWSGPAFALRQDAAIEADASLPRPWSVVWQGHLAAPRSGEYLIGAVSSGPMAIVVDGERIAWREAAEMGPASQAATSLVSAPVEGLVYLERGWHPVEVRFSAGTDDVAPEIKLYWQPPGATPGPLPSPALSPSPVEIGPADTPLPQIPLTDERLGSADFALAADPSVWQPQVRIPPTDLPPLPFSRIWSAGSCGASEGYLNSPHGLAFDPARGRVFVADTGNRRIVALNAIDGSAAVLPIEGLTEPVDVAMGHDGRLFVLDAEQPKLVIFDLDAATQTDVALAEGFYRPRGMAIDPLGLIYLADTGGARVAVVDSAGALSAQFGGPDSALGRGQPVDVLAPGDAIWAITAEHGRLWQLGTLGSYTAVQPTDTINGPQLAAAGDHLFLSDPARKQVIALDGRGRPLGALADEGAFALPTGVAAWQEGDATLLAVADTAACSVSLWRAAGNW